MASDRTGRSAPAESCNNASAMPAGDIGAAHTPLRPSVDPEPIGLDNPRPHLQAYAPLPIAGARRRRHADGPTDHLRHVHAREVLSDQDNDGSATARPGGRFFAAIRLPGSATFL